MTVCQPPLQVCTRHAVGIGSWPLSTPGQNDRFMEERSVDSRVEVCWSCPPCEVEGQDAQQAGGEPSCWNCGGPVIVTARPTVRAGGSPDAS
jgi:hypothetical protein